MVDSVATAFPVPLDVATYERLIAAGRFEDERVELLDGELVAVSPQGRHHVRSTARLAAALTRALDPRSGLEVWSHSSLPTSAWSMPEPDVVVVDRPTWSSRPPKARLVVEVAQSSLRRDRDTKARLYAAAAIPEYWIVVLRQRTVEVLTEPVAGVYTRRQILARGDVLRPVALPQVAIAVADVVPPPARRLRRGAARCRGM